MTHRSERAEAVRRLLREASHGLLSTHGLEPAGHPYGSLVQLATTAEGEPLLLLADIAQHTKNLVADPRASLLVLEATSGDPLQSRRAALIGRARRLAGEGAAEAQARYLERRPSASRYFELGFHLWVLTPLEARWVGGFGEAAWVPGTELLGAG